MNLSARLIASFVCVVFIAAGASEDSREIADALYRASYTVLNARKASELDGWLVELRRLGDTLERLRPATPERENALKRLRDAARFVQKWQDYLSAAETEKYGDAIRALKELVTTEQSPLNVPRSEILARSRLLEAKDTEKANSYAMAVLQNIRSLDDLPVALAQLKPDPRQPYRGQWYFQLVNALDALSRTYLAFKEGVATTLPPANWQTGDMPVFTRLRAELCLRVLPRILGVEKSDPPKTGETVEGYLIRLRGAALDRHDFELFGRVILAAKEISSSVGGSGQSLIGQDYTAFLFWREGQNAERAKRFFEATLAYRRALSAVATSTMPVEFVGQRLQAIEKEHPGEYKQAIEAVQRYGNQEIPPRPSGTPGALTVPAANAPPAPLEAASPAISPTP